MDRDIENNFEVFNEYVSNYGLDEDGIKLKYLHSYRVMKASEDIAKALKLDKDDIYLASLIGLIHDIARFEQWKQKKTYKDSREFDHAIEGTKLLFEEGLIKKFDCKEEEYEIIKTAILFHSSYSLPEDIKDDRALLHCKIIRDADKYDLIYLFSMKDRVIQSEEEISKKVKEMFFNYSQIKKEDVNNTNDKIILFIALIFDINYDFVLGWIYENEYLKTMLKNIENKRIFNMYFEVVTSYIEEKIFR